ncbi:BAHD acyltransferase DCR-like [Andrographis paniculata]|uniref:BAHD acyltransferase DCR-like n=1 Tax=Andrographis paniculata TaxID=175694 RepID=UPI0021E929B4|nr:BAHD acyltransferase DCR-like [Andrographis paniculata]
MVSVVSRCTVFPAQKSALPDLKLSVSDLPMLSCHYIQKGCLFLHPHFPVPEMLSHLKHSLSIALLHFPPLAGRLVTDSAGYVYITCNDAGVDFIHADGSHLLAGDLDIPAGLKGFFACDYLVSYQGHFRPLLAVQVTALADGVFIGCTVNHAVTDGTSFWNFFNTFAEVSRGGNWISRSPDFSRDSVLISPAVLKLPDGGPTVTFDVDAPLKERIFGFSRDSIRRLKAEVNYGCGKSDGGAGAGAIDLVELMGKHSHDTRGKSTAEISSFQSLCALLWRGITRARDLPSSKTTTFRMAVNCRHRLEPKLNPLYFGNAIQSIPTYATAGNVLSQDLRWCAAELHKNVVAHDGATVRKYVAAWERDPRCFPLGNFDGAMITMGSSPRFPMYDNDFGWGKPAAVGSGPANKFDGKISAFPGRGGNGSVDLEVVLDPNTMAGLESDPEFMGYVSG